jgi:hypothetical protein
MVDHVFRTLSGPHHNKLIIIDEYGDLDVQRRQGRTPIPTAYTEKCVLRRIPEVRRGLNPKQTEGEQDCQGLPE